MERGPFKKDLVLFLMRVDLLKCPYKAHDAAVSHAPPWVAGDWATTGVAAYEIIISIS
jgi:hypothetical protein